MLSLARLPGSAATDGPGRGRCRALGVRVAVGAYYDSTAHSNGYLRWADIGAILDQINKWPS
jgi:hypothetical protein